MRAVAQDAVGDIETRRRARVRRLARLRLVAEAAAVVVTLLLCLPLAGLSPPDTALVVGLVLAGILLLRALPEARSPRLPRDAPPGRAGRRAEVYRLSWGLSSAHDTVSTQVRLRLQTLVAQRLAIPPDDGVLDDHRPDGPRARLQRLADGPLRRADLRPTDLRSALTALEELDQLDPRGTR